MALVATVVRLESRIEQALLELTTAAGADAEASGEGCDAAQVQRSAQKLDHARRMMRELAALVEVRPCGLAVRPQGMGVTDGVVSPRSSALACLRRRQQLTQHPVRTRTTWNGARSMISTAACTGRC